ncbi:MAG: ferrous iron transport protein A [Bacteriovoracia bacterium]
MKLSELALGQRGRVISVRSESPVVQRLLELGFVAGAEVEVARQAPYFGDPIAVRVRGALIALRRSEAEAVEVGEVQVQS